MHKRVVQKKAAVVTMSLVSFCLPRLLQNCTDDSLNVAVPMRMLEIFSSEKTYLPVIPDANYVASLLEQILHYMVQTGKSNKISITIIVFAMIEDMQNCIVVKSVVSFAEYSQIQSSNQ